MFLIKLLSRLPFSILYLFSDLLFFMSFYVAGYRRKQVHRNLKNSFPDKSTEELKIIEKRFYQNLCDYAVEMVKLLTISKEELSRRMKFNNPELPEKFKSQNQSILF